jgi:hypothetical protein
MTSMRALPAAIVLWAAFAGPALAVTPEELAALARAGLGDEVLLALIESTGVDQAVNATRSLALKQAGVSERVIAAAVRASHRAPDAGEPVPLATAECIDCQPNVAVIGGPPPVAVVEREIYYVPVWAAPVIPVRPGPPRPYLEGNRGFGRFINDGFVDRAPAPATRRPPRPRAAADRQ